MDYFNILKRKKVPANESFSSVAFVGAATSNSLPKVSAADDHFLESLLQCKL
jgi:hypothetical protein